MPTVSSRYKYTIVISTRFHRSTGTTLLLPGFTILHAAVVKMLGYVVAVWAVAIIGGLLPYAGESAEERNNSTLDLTEYEKHVLVRKHLPEICYRAKYLVPYYSVS